MRFWRSLFGKKEVASDWVEQPIPSDFNTLTSRAIELMGSVSSEMENEELYDFLVYKGFPAYEATELVIFLPIAFCRKMLPELDWPTTYVDYISESNTDTRFYTENPRFRIIEEETERYWGDQPNNDYVISITGRSADFNAINQLLNAGGTLEDVGLSETVVFR